MPPSLKIVGAVKLPTSPNPETILELSTHSVPFHWYPAKVPLYIPTITFQTPLSLKNVGKNKPAIAGIKPLEILEFPTHPVEPFIGKY